MALDKTTSSYAHGAGSGQPLPKVSPPETKQAVQDGKTYQASMDRLKSQGKTAKTGENKTQVTRGGQQASEEDRWLQQLRDLEAQPVNDTELPESQQSPHMKLSQSQLENMDSLDIMDAMERGEW
ncbi:hypothetical protein VPNG_07057 [Cytospora leucostoma]|uniref:Uncharacterized protein n=1 Tax=Cytospora leucostoma TaxID=1230097 RepID=A0A423WV95_9PEZI|nr:hypothetical protein VPNG_07057 [Cytospora leucostoma]